MLKKQKKITKHEIKEDKLVSTYFGARTWIEQNRKLVANVVIVLAAVIVAVFLYSKKRADWNDTAMTQLAKILPYYEQGRYLESINGIPQEGAQGLQNIVDEYGSTKSGEMAKFYLANAYFNLHNFDKALENFKDVSFSDRMVSASALAGAAACYEAKGDRSDAASYFERAAFKDMSNLLAPDNLQNAAADYAAAGNKAKAVELMKTLKKDFPNSSAAREADRYIAEYSF